MIRLAMAQNSLVGEGWFGGGSDFPIPTEGEMVPRFGQNLKWDMCSIMAKFGEKKQNSIHLKCPRTNKNKTHFK